MPDSGQRFYDDDEANAILRLAAQEGATTTGVDRNKLFDMAAELGISPEAVARAEQQVEKQRLIDAAAAEEGQLRAAYQRKRRDDFWSNLAGFLGFNAMLIGIWFFTGRDYFWPGWVLAFWGAAVIGDLFKTFAIKADFEQGFERYKRKRQRRSADVMKLGRPSELLSDRLTVHAMTKAQATQFLVDECSLTSADARKVADAYELDHPTAFL